MSLNSQTIEQLFVAFNTSHNAQTRKAAQTQIVTLRQTVTNYPVCVLQLVANQKIEIQLPAAIEFKLWSQHFANIEQFESDKYLAFLPWIKTSVLQLYLTVNVKVYKQLKQAIGYICEKEYFESWKQLPQQLISVAGTNYDYLVRVLALFKKITRRYSYETRSDPLFKQIIFSCDHMHDFLLSTTEHLLKIVQVNQQIQPLKALKQALKLFYNLNYQDLHPKFEDNLDKWMKILVQALKIVGEDSNIQLFKVKGAALKSILLYSNKYQDDIYEQTIQSFSTQVWKLFSEGSNRNNPNLEDLLLDGLKFFKFLISWSGTKKLYAGHIHQLMESLVLPHISVTNDVKEEFNDQPERFIEGYFQNSDYSSKRSHAIDLLKSIQRVYPNEVNNYLISYISRCNNNTISIEDECLLYNLLIQVGAGSYRSIEGCTHLKIDETILRNCYLKILKPKFQVIYQYLVNNSGKQVEANFSALQIAFQLRYIFVFRIYIPQQELSLLLQYTSSLVSNHETLRNIIYMTTNAFLTIRHGDYLNFKNLVHYFSSQNTQTIAQNLLQMIYMNQQKEQILNLRLNTLFYSITTILKQQIVTYSSVIITLIKSFLSKTETYEFKTIVPIFEGFSNFLYWMVTQNEDISQIETFLKQYFTKIMAIGSDLLSFIFQLFSIVVLLKNNLIDTYPSIYTSLMKMQNWTQNNSSLFSSYAFYITSFLQKHPEKIASDKPNIQLILSKLIEAQKPAIFFNILNEIYNKCDIGTFASSGYLKIVLIGIQSLVNFNVEQKNHILKLSLILISQIINTSNAQQVINYMNQSSPGFIQGILLQSLPVVKTISWRQQRRPIFVAICTLLHTNCFTSIENFGKVLNALVNNTNRRARFTAIQKNAPPVQGSFQKLSIFKTIKNNLFPQKKVQFVEQNQQKYFVNCVNKLIIDNGIQKIGGVLTEQNQKQLTNLISKYQEEKQQVL